MRGLTVFCLVVALLCSWLVFFEFLDLYGVPFGMSDVDRYLPWFGVDLEPRVVGEAHSLLSWAVHGGLIVVVGWFPGDPGVVISFLMPLVVWSLCPLAVWGFYRSSSKDPWMCVFLLFFGCFQVFMWLFCSLWSQAVSYLFFLCGLSCFYKKSWVFFMLSILCSILFHPYIGVVWGLFAVGVSRGRWSVIFALSGIVLVLGLFGPGVLVHTVLGSSFNEPSFYYLLFFFSFPLFMFDLVERWPDVVPSKRLMLIFVVFGVLTSLGRGLVYLQPFLVLNFVRGLENKSYRFRVAVVVGVFLYFSSLYIFFIGQMVREMPKRGLDPFWLIELL